MLTKEVFHRIMYLIPFIDVLYCSSIKNSNNVNKKRISSEKDQ